MKEIHNGKNRAGRKVYRVIAQQTRENHEPETCYIEYNSGRHAADRGILGTWTVRSLNEGNETYSTFEEAAHAFEDRTNSEAPEPNFEV